MLACDPTYQCCGFPVSGEVTSYGIGENLCSCTWIVNGGDVEYEAACEHLGSDEAICTCSWDPWEGVDAIQILEDRGVGLEHDC
jgi:hypothetical protein